MDRSRAARIGIVIAALVCITAIMPSHAWAPGSPALSGASPVRDRLVLRADDELTVARTDVSQAVLVSTGDGGGAGRIDGFDGEPFVVAETTFRGQHAWEIGTAPDRPASYVNDNGVRLDDGMLDRLRARALALTVGCAAAIIGLGYRRRASGG